MSEYNQMIPKKRGRKSTKKSEEMVDLNVAVSLEPPVEPVEIDKDINEDNKVKNNELELNNEKDKDTDNDNELNNEKDFEGEKPIAKKRGRKPKGGKIIQQVLPPTNVKETKPNIILHLKCSLKDLQLENVFGQNVEGFSFSSSATIFNETSHKSKPTFHYDHDTSDMYCHDADDKEVDIRDIWKKLKVLEHDLHHNNTENKKSACFWDTCEFDNPPIYIPKYFMNNSYHVYGCFCSPECAVAHLMEENIDSSVKFERYQLMNHIYSKIYDYNKNIKPAPNPYYTLEKYYGNLSIQEYRTLLRSERLFLVVDKPLTRVMPELHEDNDDFIINNKIIPSNTYQVKKKMQKKQTKTTILSEKFGLTD